MKVIGFGSLSQEQERAKIIFLQCRTSIGNKSGSVEDRAVKFACSMGFSAMANQMVCPRLCHVTGGEWGGCFPSPAE